MKKKLTNENIKVINKKLNKNWNDIRNEFKNITKSKKELIKIFNFNKINYKKFGFSKKLFISSILNAKFIRDRFTILDITDNCKILKKKFN